jgi:hypothetical protein
MKQASAQEFIKTQVAVLAMRALRDAYSNINQTHFKGKLRTPIFGLSDTQTRLGQWMSAHRRLEISSELLLSHRWGTVVEVLKHEMAHQYVDEVLHCADESAHGPTFQQVCDERGIDARAHGVIGDHQQKRPQNEPVLERVSRLLALAKSSNQNEAQAAMTAAQRLMLKYNLADIESRARSQYGFRHLGEPTGRVNESQRVLALIIAEHFFVDVIWVPVWRVLEGKRGSILEVCGTSANLEMAEYVYCFLTQTADRLWREHKQHHQLKSARDRLAYLAGVMTGFYDKLNGQKNRQGHEGLVWIGDPELKRYLKRRHPYTRCSYHTSSRANPAHTDGRIAGEHIVLNRGIRKGPTAGAKLLPADA